jgi:hypothetical protein
VRVAAAAAGGAAEEEEAPREGANAASASEGKEARPAGATTAGAAELTKCPSGEGFALDLLRRSERPAGTVQLLVADTNLE